MGNDDEALDLLIAHIGEREHRPVRVALARAHVHAANDAIGARRSGYENAVAFSAVPLGGRREIDGGRIAAHVDRVDRARRREAESQERKHGCYARADTTQALPSKAHPSSPEASAGAMQSASQPTLANFTSFSRRGRAAKLPASVLRTPA